VQSSLSCSFWGSSDCAERRATASGFPGLPDHLQDTLLRLSTERLLVDNRDSKPGAGSQRSRRWWLQGLSSLRASVVSHWTRAHHDLLTGLPNRRLFLDRMEQELKHATRSSLPLAVQFMDLDGFKEVNDSRGHEAGDRLLSAGAASAA
jgi:GGDEF domain-containing protein